MEENWSNSKIRTTNDQQTLKVITRKILKQKLFNVRGWQWLKVMIKYKVDCSIDAYVNESDSKVRYKVQSAPAFL